MKTIRIVFILALLLLVSTAMPAQNTSKRYAEKVRVNAAAFHRNFSTGDFDKNAPLVNKKIYVNSNNIIVVGRDNFVQRIKRYSIPFPRLMLRDRVLIVDENEVALLYIMQGVQDGPYGSMPASGNKINVYAAEFFTMDDAALMKELLTITQLDRLKQQISGAQKVDEYETVTLLPIKKTSPGFKNAVKKNLSAYIQHFNTRDWSAFKDLFAAYATINLNGKMLYGAQEFADELDERLKLLPDISYHEIKNVAEGDRGALAYEVNGTFIIPAQAGGKEATTKAAAFKEGIHLQFDRNGKIINAVIVSNGDDWYN